MIGRMPAGEECFEPEPRVRVLESCTSTWIFDTSGRRFRRIPRGCRLDGPVPAHAWIPYHRLEAHAGNPAFAVVLDPKARRVLRSWLHGDPCPQCEPRPTAHRPLSELRQLIWRLQLRLGAVEPGADSPPGVDAARRRRFVFGGK